MERRLAVHARTYRQALIAIVVAATPVAAAPKSGPAKVAFDEGLAAYQQEAWATASAAFGKSYAFEADTETLFAWAQTERKQGHCDKALELYEKLLAAKLPEENKAAVATMRDECRAIINPPPPYVPTTRQMMLPLPPPPPPEARWYLDPIGDGLAIGGVLAIGFGTAMLVVGHAADSAKDRAPTYREFASQRDRASRDGTLGVASLVVGVAALGGGIAWYATHRHRTSPTLTAWGDASSGGVSVAGRF